MRRFPVVAAAVVGALGLTVASAGAAGPAPRIVQRYLNIHQCVYVGLGQHYTNVLPNTADAGLNTGTKASGSADTVLSCGPGGGGWSLAPANSAVKSFDLSTGRYLNLHQCVYVAGGQHYTALLPNTPNVNFNTGSNVSDAADTTLKCAPGGGGWRLNAANSAVNSFDLAANRFLNLHQCVWTTQGQYYMSLLPNTPNLNFNTGSNVSDAADTALKCAPGGGGWSLRGVNSAFRPLGS
ncbi:MULTISPECIES: hypothetical protein [unclassified Kitasatospora]|uniref:hypothetical protein n=1 Tax=unclassified Kitasatospora TaxID=2633591 RepID=UPI000710F3B0|nr:MULTISPECIES: hypothetical protein [unclassified Kitasatospora]KQV22255.1 hypothetical protein ASC99_18110 [Kitasatospora sp. Root107]KRB64652.1 hypothetical protein ASE03_33155 [Kitasatospora sp. Root187]